MKLQITMYTHWNHIKSISPSKKDTPSSANCIDAMIDPANDSNKSAPIPATSPTLSPTLSAIVAGFFGSGYYYIL